MNAHNTKCMYDKPGIDKITAINISTSISISHRVHFCRNSTCIMWVQRSPGVWLPYFRCIIYYFRVLWQVYRISIFDRPHLDDVLRWNWQRANTLPRFRCNIGEALFTDFCVNVTIWILSTWTYFYAYNTYIG